MAMVFDSQQTRLIMKKDWALEIVLRFELVPCFVQSPKHSTGDHTLLSRGSGRDLNDSRSAKALKR